jgi:hypothetical protein
MIRHLQHKSAVVLLLTCFVASPAALAYEKYENQKSPDQSVFFCPAGQEDTMQYFVMRKDLREDHYLSGEANPSYTKIFPDVDFAPTGYWFWLKSSEAHGFDIKAFDEKYVYIRGTELNWKDNTTFKRKEQDAPLTTRCVPENGASPELRVSNSRFSFYASCKPYKTSSLGTILNNLDAPEMMNAGGDIGQVLTRVLHYRFNCDKHFENCKDEEQSFLGKGYGRWKWVHLKHGEVVKTTIVNHISKGTARAIPPCANASK